jgi:hypothetical protein
MMDIAQWYGVALGALAALVLIVLNFRVRLPVFLLKHIVYPQLHPLIGGGGNTTRGEAVIVVLFLAGNALCMTLGVRGSPDLVKRTAQLSAINTIPLFLGGRINALANATGVRYATYAKAHRWIGWVAVAQAILHAAVAATSQKSFRSRPEISSLVVSCPPT